MGTWGGIFLFLAASGRLRSLLNPLFWPLEIGCGVLLILLAAGYLLLLRPARLTITRRQGRRIAWKLGVLAGPLLLCTYLAPPTFSAAALERRAGLSGGRILAQSEGSSIASPNVELIDFAAAAYYPEHILEVSNKEVSYTGQYFPGPSGEFRLCRVLMSCCAQDATPIYLHVVGNAPVFSEMQWISVEGETFFRKDEGEWTPCIHLARVTPVSAPVDPYLYPVGKKPMPQ